MNAHHENYFINSLGDRIGRAVHQLAFIKSGGNFFSEQGLGITHFGCPIMHRYTQAIIGGKHTPLFDRPFMQVGASRALKLGVAAGVGAALFGWAVLPFAIGGIAIGAMTGAIDGSTYDVKRQSAWGMGSPGETGENIYSSYSALDYLDLNKIKHDIENGKVDYNKVQVGQFWIKNADPKMCGGDWNFLHAFVFSCNVGMVRIAQKLGKESFYNYVEKFGFGKATNIELANEDPGFVE
jgi:hypothetical protein